MLSRFRVTSGVRQFGRAHFEGKEPKVERKNGQRYGNEFRRQAVERMNACGNIVQLVRDLVVCRRLLYNWRDRFDETDHPRQRSRGLILRKQISKLKRLLANKTLEVDFFRHALQRVGARRSFACQQHGEEKDVVESSCKLAIVPACVLCIISAAWLGGQLQDERVPRNRQR